MLTPSFKGHFMSELSRINILETRNEKDLFFCFILTEIAKIVLLERVGQLKSDRQRWVGHH